MTKLASMTLGLAALTLLAGCGGSGGGSPATGGKAVATGFDVAWGERTREVLGPSSALSLVVTFVGAGADGKDVVTVVDRRPDPARYVQTYAVSRLVRLGARTARFEFHAASGGAGAIVATADLGGLVRPDGTFTRADGSAFGPIATVGRVAKVTVTGPATASVNVPVTFGAAAFDADGNPLALSPGSFLFASSAFPGITPQGVLTPMRTGPVTVTANADGVTSDPLTVAVGYAEGSGLRLVNQPANALAFTPDGTRLFASTGPTGPNPNSLIEINPTTGAVRAIASLGGAGGPLGASKDGNVVYVGVGTIIRRIDTVNGEIAAPISLGSSANFDDAYTAGSIAVSPADPETFAVVRRTQSFTGYGGTALYRRGVLESETTSSFSSDSGGIVRFSEDGQSLYDYDSQSSAAALTRYAVGPEGLTRTTRRDRLTAQFASNYIVRGGELVFPDGQILDAATLAEVGRFTIADRSQAVSLNSDGTRAYFGPVASQTAEILAFDTTTRAEVARVPLGEVATFVPVEDGAAGRIAFVTSLTSDGRILLVDAPVATGGRSRRP